MNTSQNSQFDKHTDQNIIKSDEQSWNDAIEQVISFHENRHSAGRHFNSSRGKPRLTLTIGFFLLYLGILFDIIAVGATKQPFPIIDPTTALDAHIYITPCLILSIPLICLGIYLVIKGIKSAQLAINSVSDDESFHISLWTKRFLTSATLFLVMEILTLLFLIFRQ